HGDPPPARHHPRDRPRDPDQRRPHLRRWSESRSPHRPQTHHPIPHPRRSPGTRQLLPRPVTQVSRPACFVLLRISAPNSRPTNPRTPPDPTRTSPSASVNPPAALPASTAPTPRSPSPHPRDSSLPPPPSTPTSRANSLRSVHAPDTASPATP